MRAGGPSEGRGAFFLGCMYGEADEYVEMDGVRVYKVALVCTCIMLLLCACVLPKYLRLELP